MSASFTRLFEDLEQRLPEDLGGRQQQRILPEAGADLFVAVANPHKRRSVILEVDHDVAAKTEVRDDIRGVELLVRLGRPGGRAHVEVALVDPGAADVFSVLADDVTKAAASGPDERTSLELFLGRLAKWQHFLERAMRGLSPERQRGLVAELWVLTTQIAPRVGTTPAIHSWLGPTGAVRDFEGSGGAVEVKSSISNQPQVARINGERQLDDTGVPRLLLAHLALDVHRDHGLTLPGAVAAARDMADGGAAAALLEERLLGAGYHDVHEPLYKRTAYDVLRFDLFHVRPGFPRLVGADLPEGVGGLRYQLSIAACEAFSVAIDTFNLCPVDGETDHAG